MSFAVVRVRAGINAKGDVCDTLAMLNLHRVNHCIIIPKTPPNMGMLNKAKDYITWGEPKPETLAKLILMRGRLQGDVPLTDAYIKENTKYTSILALSKGLLKDETRYSDIKGVKPIFRLNPPIGGFEGIKRAYRTGGTLGYRGEDINRLLDRMLLVYSARPKGTKLKGGRKPPSQPTKTMHIVYKGTAAKPEHKPPVKKAEQRPGAKGHPKPVAKPKPAEHPKPAGQKAQAEHEGPKEHKVKPKKKGAE